MTNRTYIAIDLKSFYASVECVERKLNPLTTNLVVADKSRTEKTICLAVSPSLKEYGIGGRARLFEVVQKVKEINIQRKMTAKNHCFSGSSYNSAELKNDSSLELDFIAAPPRMALYMEYSTAIYNIYLKYIAPEDMHVYSIDEVFMDVTNYLNLYKMSARDLAKKLINEVLENTGITATAGIGSNLYLCKVAMDVEAKHIKADENGMRIAELDEMSYRKKLWSHKPITDFWRVGRGYAKRLEAVGLYTMGDVAKCSVGRAEEFYNEELLYKMFGVNAELLIDHAWGYEPCTIADIKGYIPMNNSLSSGQVLQCPYDYKKAKLVVKEMTDNLSFELVDKGLVTDQIVLTIGYDIENLTNAEIMRKYRGPVTIDRYGRKIPKHSHGTFNLKIPTSSAKLMIEGVCKLYDSIVNENLLIRRLTVALNHIVRENEVKSDNKGEQLDIFTDYGSLEKQKEEEKKLLEKEKKMQMAILELKKKYGKNAVLKGMNFEEGTTAVARNGQIGGHKA